MNTTTTSTTTRNPLLAGLEKSTNQNVTTANGAVSNASTLNRVLDFFASAGALRNASNDKVLDLFGKAFAEDRLLTLKLLFYFRDVREGQGERKVFRTIIKHLAQFYPEVLRKNLSLVSEYGRWDDLFVLEGTKLWDDVVKLVDNQLLQDRKNLKEGNGVSLLGKWMPSINTSSSETRKLATLFVNAFSMTPKVYRKMLSKLRNEINIVESMMSAGNFGEIDYEKVPSRASMIYRKSFGKRDTARYGAYLASVEKGEAKINSSTLYPYDIVRNILNNINSSDQTLDLQWKALPNYLKVPKNILCIADVSGSMTSALSGNVRPIDVSISLAMYTAERNIGVFNNYFITFSNQPQLVKIVGNNIYEKVKFINRAHWEQNTNLQAVFDLILDTALKNKVPQEELPESLIIISDMQFDVATTSYSYGSRSASSATNFDVINEKFKRAGYRRPNLVFWNVNAASNTQFPVTIDDKGTCLVSGCSPSILKSILNSEVITPLDILNQTINVERYDAITV